VDRTTQDRLMSEVNPIEVSQRDDRVRKRSVGSNVANDLHGPCSQAPDAEKTVLAPEGLQSISRFLSLLGVWVIVDQLL
jgi:hypothetical protein